MTPLKAATGKKPDLRGVREWGCRCWVRNESKSKLGGHVDEGVWVGFDDKSKGSQVYWPSLSNVIPTLIILVHHLLALRGRIMN